MGKKESEKKENEKKENEKKENEKKENEEKEKKENEEKEKKDNEEKEKKENEEKENEEKENKENDNNNKATLRGKKNLIATEEHIMSTIKLKKRSGKNLLVLCLSDPLNLNLLNPNGYLRLLRTEGLFM